MFDVFNVSASGMEAQRQRLNVIAGNLANAETTRTAEGGAYRRRDIVFSAQRGADFAGHLRSSLAGHTTGVSVSGIVEDQRPLKYAYEPSHPDADEKGYVAYPNVNVSEEMVNMISASRSYEANVNAFKAAREMAQKAIEIGG